jgi:hypothetical protein
MVTKKITEKQRFLDTMLGKDTDRFRLFDLEPDKATIRRWRKEGLPWRKSVADYFHLKKAVIYFVSMIDPVSIFRSVIIDCIVNFSKRCAENHNLYTWE